MSQRWSQRGQAIVLVGLILVVLFGFLGLALDSGRAYLDRRELQASVDAAALSAAYKYMNTPDYAQAEQAATALYAHNERLYGAPACTGYGTLSATCTFGDSSGQVLTINAANHSIAGVSFTATASHSILVAIMQVLGSGPTIPISATATAVARQAGAGPAGIHTLSPNGCGGNPGFSLRITGTENTTMIGDVWSNGNINQNGSATATVTGNVVDICPPLPPPISGVTLTPGSGSETNGWTIPDPGYAAPPTNPASPSWGQYTVVQLPGTYSTDPHLTGGVNCFFLAGGVYTFQSGFTTNGGFTSNELRPPDEPALTNTTAALSALSGAISSLPVKALSVAVPASSTVTISGQAFTVTSIGAASGATSIPVNSQAVSGAIATGSTVTTTVRAANQFWGSNGVGCSGSFQPYPQGADSGNPQINASTYGVELTAVRWDGVPNCSGPVSPTCFLRESAPSMCKLVDIGSNQFLRVWTTNVPGAMAYNVYVSNGSCAGPFGYLGQISNTTTEGNRTLTGCPQTLARDQQPNTLRNCDLGASGPQNFNGSNWSPDFTINPPDGESPPVGPSPLPNSDPGPLTATPPAGDRANENQCVNSMGTRVACRPRVTAGYITPGAIVLFIPGGGSCNPGALSMNGGGDVYLFSGEQYGHILLYEPGPEQFPPPNTCSNSIGGHGVTSLLGIFYLPAATVTITGSSGYLSTISGGVICWSATINGNGSVSITGDPSLGTWPSAVHLTQ
jgi:Flp pilus assembly protein TadG